MFEKLKNSLWAKMAVLSVVMLVLCIPLSQIGGLIDERGESRREAAAELAQTYSGPQTLTGPFMVIPYTEQWVEAVFDAKGRLVDKTLRNKQGFRVVLPSKLEVRGEMQPEERYRGIFRVLFYKFKGEVSGSFPALDTSKITHSEKNSTLNIRPPYLALTLSDMRGLEGVPALEVNGSSYALEPRVPDMPEGSWLARGIHAPLPATLATAASSNEPIRFTLKMSVVGQERFGVTPIAQETSARIASPWPHPRFSGSFLATERTVSDAGFQANWNISSLTHSARQQLLAAMAQGSAKGVRTSTKSGGEDATAVAAADTAPASSAAVEDSRLSQSDLESFEVGLAQPVNAYSMSDRAIKYSALFVGLVLMAAFMFEIFRKLPLHPVQYGLVGLSIALFFLLLLALSEKLAFHLAYSLAASASVVLLFAYFSAVLRGIVRGLSLAAYVALLYGSLFVLLVSESNSLLLGALLLFGMLSALMLMTRRTDWYGVTSSAQHQA